MNYRNRIIKLTLIGFVIGIIIGLIITISIVSARTGDGRLHICDPSFNPSNTGDILSFIRQIVFPGILGAVCFGASIIYDIESWGLLKATLVHFIISMAVYVIVGFYLGWLAIDRPLSNAIQIGATALGFFIMWLVIGFGLKKDVEDMNKDLQDFKKGEKTGEEE